MNSDSGATTSGEAGSPAHLTVCDPRAAHSPGDDYVVDISNESDVFIDCRRLREGLTSVLRQEGCPAGCEMSVRITTDAVIADLHELWLGIPGPTDVLSFPQDDPRSSVVGGRTLGDVVLSAETAERQAREHGLHLEDETTLLAVHGTLHLLGYDDLTEPDYAEIAPAR